MNSGAPADRSNEGDEPRDRTREVKEVDGKTWFRDLDEAVVETDRCVECSACIAACPSDSIGKADEDNRPTLVRMCTGCSRCWDFCPRAGLRYESLQQHLDEPHEPQYHGVRTPNPDVDGQDGGAVTELLIQQLESGEIDAAIVAGEHPEDRWRAEPKLATTPEELRRHAGSYYNQTMPFADLEGLVTESQEAGELPLDPDLAFVGTPCEVEGVKALQRYPWSQDATHQNITLTVALMCTRNFDYHRLRMKLEAERDVDLEEAEKMDVQSGEFVVTDTDGEELLRTPVEELDAAALKGCNECADFTGETADVTAGSIGTSDGWTTLVTRTERGREAFDTAADSLETTEDVDVERVRKVDSWNRGKAKETMPREFDPEGSVGVPLERHLESYSDTELEPQSLSRARVHMYEERC